MTGPERHPTDELQLLLDGRLPSGQRSLVEAHLARCLRCRRELDALRRVKALLRNDLVDRPVPSEVTARVSSAVAAAAAAEATRRARAPRLWRRAAMAGLSLAAAVAVVAVLMRTGRSDPVGTAAQAFVSYRSATLGLDLETGNPQVLERFFAEARIPFTARVFDFGMMGYRLAGGKVHRVAGRESALFAYRNATGRAVVCQMYQGGLSELPSGAENREHDGIHFRVYRVAGSTLVFWQEGSVVCVLAAGGDAEEAVRLAFAKAIKV